MAAHGTLMFHDDAVVTPGAVRAWKIGFGYTTKGTVVQCYVVTVSGSIETHAAEIPLLGNGKADLSGIQAWYAGYGVALNATVRNLIGG